MRFRFLNESWAYLRGHFWMPCPHCGRMFGGHEIGERWYKDSFSNYSFATCSDPECIKEVQQHNLRIFVDS